MFAISTMLQLVLVPVMLGQMSLHGFPRGYRTSRSWGTTLQGTKGLQGISRMGRQQGDTNSLSIPLIPCTCSPSEEVEGEVCGTDGKTYSSPCDLRMVACRSERRQGRSFTSNQLRLEISHRGSCKSPCVGMDHLGHFQAFGQGATNSGLCVHDFFKCVRTLRRDSRQDSEVSECCQARFDMCSRV